MKVVHVAECVGGVDRYLSGLLKYSTCENIMILSQLYNKRKYDELADGVEIMHMTHKMGLSAIKESFELRKRIKKNKPDIVCAHSSIAGAITRMACVGIKTKVVYNPHGWSFNMEDKNKKIYIWLEKIMSLFCDAIICISEAEKKSAMREHICKKDKLHVIYNGIDIEGYKKEDVEWPIPENAFVVGMVGRICKQKAPDIFVKMAKEVQKIIPNSYFVIVGDVIEGSESEKIEVERQAKAFGVNLFITGWVGNPMSYMSKFDVGCLLSRWEGFGLAIPEYMLAGVPIVATNVDAIPNLINNDENGLLVEKDDWENAAKKVVELAKDDHKRNKLIENGKKNVVARFDVRRVSKEYEKLYNLLVIGGQK